VFWLIPNLLHKQIKQGGGGVSRQQGRKRSFLKKKLTYEYYNHIKLILFLINFPAGESFFIANDHSTMKMPLLTEF